MKNLVLISIFFLCVLTLLSSCKSDPPLPILGFPKMDENGIESKHKVDDFVFTNQANESFSSIEELNGIVVMNYFFTSCPTICPKMTDNVLTVFDHYQGDENVDFVSVTVDPGRDDPERMSLFMESHSIPLNENWHFVTGDKKALYDFARYQLFLSAMEAEVEIEDDFIHSEKVVLVDANRHIRGYYTGTDEIAMKRLKKDIKRLKYEQ